MAVAHSAASESHTGTTGSANQTAFSWTHTQTGTPQGVVVFVSTYASTADLISSVTYGGVALTRLTGGLATDGAGESGRLDTFFLGAGLGTGNQTITVNRTNNATVMYASAATVTAGADTAVPTATIVLLQGDGTLTVQSVDDTSPGVNSLRYAGCYSGLNAPPTAGTGSTLLNSIDIGNYGSALVRETTAGQGARNVGFSGTSDDRAAVHLAIRELVPRTFSQTVGSFALTGNNATFSITQNEQLLADVGTFTFTGNNAGLTKQSAVTAERGQFTLTGNNADLLHKVKLTAETGTFTFTGNAATLRVNSVLAAEPGAFALSGKNVTFKRTWNLTADKGAFTLTGNNATLTETAAKELSAVVGSFALTGKNVTLNRTYIFSCTKGTFAVTGNAASLLVGRKLAGGTGTFSLTGNNVSFLVNPALSAEVGTFSLTGNTVSFARGKALVVSAGTFNLTGIDATLTSTSTARRRVVFIF